MGALHQVVVPQRSRVAQMFQNASVNLSILLQPGMSGEVKKREQTNTRERRRNQEAIHWAGVLSSCCLVQRRFGSSSSERSKDLRASAFRRALRCARPSHIQGSADFGSSSMAFLKSATASSV